MAIALSLLLRDTSAPRLKKSPLSRRKIFELVRKRLVIPINGKLVETDVMEGIVPLDATTIYPGVAFDLKNVFPRTSEHYEYVQVVDGKIVQGFCKGSLLVI